LTGLSPDSFASRALAGLSPARRRRLLSRGVPLLVALAAAAFGAGVLVGGLGKSDAERVAGQFAAAWERGDFRAMHRLIEDADRERAPLAAFRAAYERAALTATAEAVDTGEPREDGDRARVPVTVRTRVFGTVRGSVLLRVADERVDWDRSLVFPGMRGAERLARVTQAPPRAAIRSRDGREIVSGPVEARTPSGTVASSIAGTVGPAETEEERQDLRRRGFPPDAPIGKTGLERAAEAYVAGTPGGRLTAGGRTLARSRPRAAEPVRTTIDLRVQEAAVEGLAGRFGGIAAIDPRTGQVRALAGIAFSAPQPPGSVFKVITATAGLESGAVRPSSRFPVETKAVIEGVDLENANGESCGGTFVDSFAHSCNSVFAPLGVRVGPQRLVETAERYGFNRPAGLPGAAESTLPAPGEIGGDLAVGSTAIGQGKVLATPLLFASVAQTIASDGVRRPPVVVADAAPPRPQRVTSPRVARQIERMMVAVVRRGTGTAAAIDGVRVAGKTGTAELEDTTDQAPEEGGDPAADTNAWFTAYAPARRPKLAVAVMLVKAGAGGETAAPAARVVLEAAVR
jgi:penicillin-binding protein A